jgi:8-oxo-dGTP pyrophosphatase MutT (NUDIX family)
MRLGPHRRVNDDRSNVPFTARRAAAVLIPWLERPGESPSLAFIHRSKHGHHGDQVSFPGGRIEPDDETPVAAALREFEEEMGVPRGEVEVLEVLPVMETRTTGYRVVPVLGRLGRLPEWSPDPREVAGVLVVTLDDLRRAERRGEAAMPWSGGVTARAFPYIEIGRHRIWGLTYRILEIVMPRLERYRAG